MTMPNSPMHFESQKERWIKYGANVTIVSLLAVVLAVVVSILAGYANRRVDTTTAGLFSLKGQTLGIIKANTTPIKIVCLFAEPKFDPETPAQDRFDPRPPVYDLLDEYQRKGKNITVDIIDPEKQQTKNDQLIEEVTQRYGGEVKAYKEVTDEYPAIYSKIEELVKAEMAKFAELQKQVNNPSLEDQISQIDGTFRDFVKDLRDTRDALKDYLKSRPPDYKSAVDDIRTKARRLSSLTGQILDSFLGLKDATQLPAAFAEYIKSAPPRYEEFKKIADDLVARIDKLGELKIDQVRQTLRSRDAIVVMGEKEMRTIDMDKIWVVPRDIRGFTAEGKPKPRFAGEQQITSAIVALTAKSKPKVVFVRAGGSALTTAGFPPIIPGGPFSIIAERLRDYNFEVLDKDLSGMPVQNQFGGAEATDEQLKDAIWVVVGRSSGQQMRPPPAIAPRLKEHLDQGGSALVLADIRGESFAEALDPWGIKVRADAVVVHEPVIGGRDSTDVIEQVQRNPVIFVLRNYGDHPITKPLQSLDGIFIPVLPVFVDPQAGVTSTKLIPVPQVLKTWGETNLENLEGDRLARGEGDLDPPFFAGAAAEKTGGSRLVVFGSARFSSDDLLTFTDPSLEKQRIYVSRFPANGDLFTNAIFWLSHQDTMIAISPSAMEISRIGDIGPAALVFWRIGVMLIVLPGLVIAAGIWMFFNRRD
jgi:hypothetical protein